MVSCCGGDWKAKRSGRSARKVERKRIGKAYGAHQKRVGRGAAVDRLSPPSVVSACGRTISEVQLDAELYLARPAVAVEVAERAVAGDGDAGHALRLADVEGRVTEPVEARVIQQVEELGAELEARA